jgi:hypothetical protein
MQPFFQPINDSLCIKVRLITRCKAVRSGSESVKISDYGVTIIYIGSVTFEKLISAQQMNNFPDFMEPESSSPFSQEPTAFPYPAVFNFV